MSTDDISEIGGYVVLIAYATSWEYLSIVVVGGIELDAHVLVLCAAAAMAQSLRTSEGCKRK